MKNLKLVFRVEVCRANEDDPKEVIAPDQQIVMQFNPDALGKFTGADGENLSKLCYIGELVDAASMAARQHIRRQILEWAGERE